MTTTRGKSIEFELAKSTAKRDLYFAEIQEIYDLSRDINDPEKAFAFRTRFRHYEDIRGKFLKMVEAVNDLQFQLDNNFKPDYELLRTAERLRYSILAAADYTKKNEGSEPPPACPFKLPKISLPEFNGDFTSWPLFFEKFTAIIHQNPALDDLARIHYLMGALKGKALDVCIGLTPTAANYPILLEALKSRYDNKRLLADHFFGQILEVKQLNQESASGLSQVLVRVDTAYKSLQNLQLPDLTDYLMTHILLSKLDSATRRSFETSKQTQIPSYAEVREFLHKQIDALAQIPNTRSYHRNHPASAPPKSSASGWKTFFSQVAPSRQLNENNNNNRNNNNSNKNNSSNNNNIKNNSKPINCPICNNAHQVFRCDSFIKLNPYDRLKLVQNGNWCSNCLSHTHSVNVCKSRFTCRICHQGHHTLLHLETSQNSPAEESASSPSQPSLQETPAKNFFTNFLFPSPQKSLNENVQLLPTAMINIETPFGDRKARFLIDSGSQRNFISQTCCHELSLTYHRKLVSLEGMGCVPLQAIGVTNLVIKSVLNSNIRFEVSALVAEEITHQLPTETVNIDEVQFLQGLPLADKDFFRPGKVDGILGVQIFGKILTGPAVPGPDQTLHAIPTSLGHIVMGDAPRANPGTRSAFDVISSFCILDNPSLNRALQRFWELEEVPNEPKLSREEKHCAELFQRSTTRIEGGRYCVELPFKEFPPLLGDSFSHAQKRLLSLERRFKKDPEFQVQYADVIHDYLNQGHLSPVSVPTISEDSYFIPHFAVLKESSSTPLRIVFDASARTSNGRSLNDVLFSGPKLQKDLSQVLISFRASAVALLADIRQMYRNISVQPQHRRYQRILWRESPHDSLQAFQLNCVVFGVTAAPYLALRTVEQLAADEAARFPLAANLASRHMYIDDLVVSLDSVSAALTAYQQLLGFFRAGGFKLTKWASNSREVMDVIPSEDRNSHFIDFTDSSDTNETIKVLGITWDSRSDLFSFKITPFIPKFTKRGLLSVVARIWDPLGFLAPVILLAKLIIKEVWSTGLGWDDELQSGLRSRWQQFVDELPCLHDLRISRHFSTSAEDSVTLIGFADSSEQGYGAVVYLRVRRKCPEVHLVYAKSRVAPKKAVTIPKLELCAAVLLARIMKVCIDTLRPRFQSISTVALTDSTVTLAWIKNDNQKRETFVANRVAAIEKILGPESWFHVKGEDNIADIITRGLSPKQLLHHAFWLHGPPWLKLDFTQWPIQDEGSFKQDGKLNYTPLHEEPIVSLLAAPPKAAESIEEFLRRFSSWNKLLRVTVYLLRFGSRLPSRVRGDPTLLETAERVLIRQVQREHFPGELALLAKKEHCSARLRSLSPFLDGEIIRVGGRLSYSTLPYDSKHPILLPKGSHLSTLIINDCHESNFHTGPNLVYAIVRQKYWILSARSAIRKLINSCNFCFKKNPHSKYPQMADLPAARVQEAKPFLHAGVDYAGPFHITMSRRRGVRSLKAYLCLFICLSTKAVHLELASSLSSDTFLACFKRFVARRGPVQCLYSDRGTNFIGAKAELDKIHQFVQSADFLNPLVSFLDTRRISWKFNPPLAPHFGGIWEANIRSVKTHLNKIIGAQILSYEEFNTVLTQIEALLNSRPLCAVSSDPAEPEALTPAHFLTFTPLQSLPLSDRVPSLSHHARKALLDSMVRSFWERWRRDYLTSLQHRRKWNTASDPLKVGTVVVVKSDSAPPLQWPLAVVEEVHPGPDGVIRVATVRTGKTTFQRPVAILCPLPSQ